MRRLTRRTWLGIGVALLGDAAVGDADAQAPAAAAPAADPAPRVKTGGEPYLRDGGPSDTRTRVTRDLILLDGCLRQFDELIAANDGRAARRRIDDATLEYREKVEPYMKGQGVKPFTPLVEAMTRALDQRDATAITRLRAQLQAKHAEADRAFRKFRTPYHQFALRASIEALKVAAKSYASAYAGATPEVADYQDGRGAFAAVAATVTTIRPDLERVDRTAAARVVAALAAIQVVWPSLAPPSPAPATPEAVDALVESMEQAATPFWAPLP